jgi:carboxypeptidase Taq
MDKRYRKVLEFSKNVHVLSSIQGLADWDKETYMPHEAIEARAAQLELLAHLSHKAQVSKAFAKALDALIDIQTGTIKDPQLSFPEKAALRAWRRDYIKAVKLPASFVKRFAKTVSTASHVWKMAKEQNDFRRFAPYLDQIVSLCRKKAEILGYTDHPYDALLDLFEPEMTTTYLTHLFEALKFELQELIKRVKPAPESRFLDISIPKEKQLVLCHKILDAMGFDPATSRLDLSAHPFCSGLHPKDMRMTTAVHLDDLMFALSATMHEGGHALYGQGLPAEHFGSPLCESVSLGIDESQSRWWETRIGLSLPFWRFFYPILQRELPTIFEGVSAHDFYEAINHVKPGPIRIQSDEVTYNLHIVVRFELEKGLIEGKIKTKDIPALWNEKMRENLGITPKDDAEGCLQDIHWSLGAIGYFPTYTLGNLYASQFFAVFAHTHPNWEEKVAEGQLGFIREWLRQHIHQYGRQYSAAELCQNTTGKPLSAAPFVAYLKKKYN